MTSSIRAQTRGKTLSGTPSLGTTSSMRKVDFKPKKEKGYLPTNAPLMMQKNTMRKYKEQKISFFGDKLTNPFSDSEIDMSGFQEFMDDDEYQDHEEFSIDNRVSRIQLNIFCTYFQRKLKFQN